MKLKFFGAAREVTGSCYRVETESVRFLVDCGMFQGRDADTKNQHALALDVKELDFVLLTHAHIDHSGLIPRLVAEGFGGPIYTTRATCDLLAVMLLDSAHIQEKDAEWENERARRGDKRADKNAIPLYTVAEARASLDSLHPVAYDTEIKPHPTVRVRFRDAGHILGSAILEIELDTEGVTRKLVFSGDLGQPGRPLMNDPTPIEAADYLVVESTYANRNHKSLEQTIEELTEAVNTTIERGRGNVVIPAFAVGRTQELLYLLSDLVRQGQIHGRPHVFVDSPMATAATEITLKHRKLLDEEAQEMWRQHMSDQGDLSIRFTESADESKAINLIRSGAIIISASGMCDAGRIKHHLRHNLPRSECCVVFVGFQAQGTLGRRLVDGAQSVRLMGEDVPVRARIYTIGGLSAHADRDALLGWLGHFRKSPRQVFVVHGEEEVAQGFAADLNSKFNWQAVAPVAGQEFDLA
jgi:metallo-beta-lactamase family protein